jgi:hypothetical protein
MRLTRFAVPLALAAAFVATAASAQSVSPMRRNWTTPSDTQGFRITVGNPYKQPMTFEVVAMDPEFRTAAAHAAVQPRLLRLGVGQSQSVLVAFKIGADSQERTIAVCVLPKDLEGPVLPRVCGTYTGARLVPRPGQ